MSDYPLPEFTDIRWGSVFPLPRLMGVVAPTDPPDPPEGNEDHTLWWAKVGDGMEVPIPFAVIEEMERTSDRLLLFRGEEHAAGGWGRIRLELNAAAARVAQRDCP